MSIAMALAVEVLGKVAVVKVVLVEGALIVGCWKWRSEGFFFLEVWRDLWPESFVELRTVDCFRG